MNGHLQRAAKKVREARLLIEAAAQQAPEIADELHPAIVTAKRTEDRAAALLRQGFHNGKDG